MASAEFESYSSDADIRVIRLLESLKHKTRRVMEAVDKLRRLLTAQKSCKAYLQHMLHNSEKLTDLLYQSDDFAGKERRAKKAAKSLHGL